MASVVSEESRLHSTWETTQSRPRYNFPPNIWRDRLASIPFNQDELEWYEREVQMLKSKVEVTLKETSGDAVEKIKLINLLCRLGLSYHFQNDIEIQLHHMFDAGLDNLVGEKDYDLYTISVIFRVFRQHGIKMSSDIFNKFKDSEEKGNKFKESLCKDPKGLLSFFEAAHLSRHGEDILDEALAFTRTQLQLLLAQPECNFADEIASSLMTPLYKGPIRLKAREFISFYENYDELRNDTLLLLLLKFAKMDYNRVQLLHQQEIRTVFEWWKGMDLGSKLPYARDRVMEYFLWGTCTFFEPKYAYARMEYVKQIHLVTFLDDTYDSYGTVLELQILTDAFERWDRAIIDELPKDYMKHLYKAYLDTFHELEKHAAEDGTVLAISTTRDCVVELAKCYLIEAQWCKNGYMPSFQENLEMGVITGGSRFMNAVAFMGMGGNLTLQGLQWLQDNPHMVSATGLIARLADDVASYKRERESGFAISCFLCYQRENNISAEETAAEFRRKRSDAWKSLNEELLRLAPTVPFEILNVVLNFGRAMEFTYREGDGVTDGIVSEGYIKTLFFDPIPI